jgi:potassium efflux system protein
VPALQWTFSAAHWQAAAGAMQAELARKPLWPAVALLSAGLLLALRGRLRRALLALSPAALTVDRYGIGHALAALGVTCLLALPLPLLMWAAAGTLLGAPESQDFVGALSEALYQVGRLLLALLVSTWLLDRNGVAVRHFGWDEALVAVTARHLRRGLAIFVPLIFLAAVNGHGARAVCQRGEPRPPGLSLASLTVAVFFFRLLLPGSALMRRLREYAPRSWVLRLRPSSGWLCWPVFPAAWRYSRWPATSSRPATSSDDSSIRCLWCWGRGSLRPDGPVGADSAPAARP